MGVPCSNQNFGAREQGGSHPPASCSGYGAVIQGWMCQHSCRRSPPPRVPKLSPASGDPAPPPPTGICLGRQTRRAPALGKEDCSLVLSERINIKSTDVRGTAECLASSMGFEGSKEGS